MGETRPSDPRAKSRLVGVAEYVRNAECEKHRYGDDGKRDQKHTRHQLDRLIGLFLFLLCFIHIPINAQPRGNRAPSHGGSEASR